MTAVDVWTMKSTSPPHSRVIEQDHHRLQVKALSLLAFIAFLSAFFDGYYQPPDDGGWHVYTAYLCLFILFTCAIAAGFIKARRLVVSGWMIILTLLIGTSVTFVTGTIASVLITIVGAMCLLVVLPENILPSNAPRGVAWSLLLCASYVTSMITRHVLRADVLSTESEMPYIIASGPVFIYLVYAMNERIFRTLRTTLAQTQEAHEEIAQINAALQDKSRELSRALENAYLASEAKGRFLANMSHELRTPLNAILGYAAIVQEEIEELGERADIPPSLLEDLSHVETAGKHLLGLISDILDLSRIEAGQVQLEFEEVHLETLFDEFYQVMRPMAFKRHNLLHVEVSPKHLTFYSDTTRLRQILFNLLGNAAKFTDNGHITLRATEIDEDHILFEVEDTGKGIPLDKQAKLFDPFEQVDATSTRIHGGAGLGLALCKQLTQLLGGTIQLESTPGEGSTFSFVLPKQSDDLVLHKRAGDKPRRPQTGAEHHD